MDSVDVLGVKIQVTNVSNAKQTIINWILQKKCVYVCVAPVATIMDAQDDPEYRAVVNNSGMTVPDGMPLVWLGKLAWKNIQRTYGPDVMLAVCDQGRELKIKHFFYGGTDETNRQLVENLYQKFPGIQIAGTFAPGVIRVKEEEKPDTLALINHANPDILWVGLGSPKQDFWMSIHRDQLQVPVMVGVGAAFDFIAGTKQQAPVWMRRIGLEWFFRLCCEPKRLWRRYLIGNSRFALFVMRDAFNKAVHLKKREHV